MNTSIPYFFNIQYWYCVFVSLFGNKCTYLEEAAAGAPSVGFWDWLFGGSPFFAAIGALFKFLWSLFSALSYTLSFLLFLVIAGSLVGLFLIRAREREIYSNLPLAEAMPRPTGSRWPALLESAMSSDPLKWKEAILGADLMLGELFASLGYSGENTAERIRSIPEGAFANLPSAWEAHRIKNFVFASSSHFILTQREAFRTMKLYEQVFKEFDFV